MNWLLKYTLITTLVLTGLGILGVMILGELPDSVIIINPYFENLIAFCAYSAMAICGVGFFSIFIKFLRIPVGIATCVLLMLLLNFACWDAVLQNISYRVAKASESAEREMVIAVNDDTISDLSFRFLDDDNSEEFSADVPEFLAYRLHQGDTCVAVVWDGVLGIQFISKIKNVRRNNSNNQ
jgi:hypothetical protein